MGSNMLLSAMLGESLRGRGCGPPLGNRPNIAERPDFSPGHSTFPLNFGRVLGFSAIGRATPPPFALPRGNPPNERKNKSQIWNKIKGQVRGPASKSDFSSVFGELASASALFLSPSPRQVAEVGQNCLNLVEVGRIHSWFHVSFSHSIIQSFIQ